MHGPHHREVLQAHLAGPVLADGDARVGADEVDAGAADGGHAHEVVGAGQEGGERGGERHPAARGHPHRGGDHLLLGDVALEVALGVFLGEELGPRGVADLAVQGDDVAARGADGGERLAERVAGGDLFALVVARQLGLSGARRVQGPRGLGRVHPHLDVAGAAEFGHGLLGLRQGLAVLSLAVLHGRDALALEGAGDDRGGLSPGGQGLAVGTVDGVDVVAVDLDRVPSEGPETARVGVEVVAVPGGAALAEAVDVDDHGEVVEVLVPGVFGGLPHRSLGQLAVAAQHPHAEVGVLEPLAGQRDADAHGQSLAERTGGGLDPRQSLRRGVPLQAAAQLAEGEQFLVVDGAGRLEGGVQQGRGVSLGEHEAVVAGVVGAFEVVAEVVGQQYGHQVRGGHRRRRVSGARGGGRPYAVDAQLLSEVDEFTGVHESPSSARPSVRLTGPGAMSGPGGGWCAGGSGPGSVGGPAERLGPGEAVGRLPAAPAPVPREAFPGLAEPPRAGRGPAASTARRGLPDARGDPDGPFLASPPRSWFLAGSPPGWFLADSPPGWFLAGSPAD